MFFRRDWGRVMLLRSITKHVKDQNWFAVFLDFFIVVAGILIAFQITNWSERQGDREREYEYLVRLHEDFTASALRLGAETQELQQQLNDQEIVLATLDSCTLTPENRPKFERGLVRLGWINSPMYIRRTIDELISSGEMGLIRNGALRKTIADMTAEIEWRASVTDAIHRVTEHHRYIVAEHVRYSAPGADDVVLVATGFELQTLCQDPKIASAISNVGLSTRERKGAYSRLLEGYNEVLSQLEAELSSEWQHDATKVKEK